MGTDFNGGQINTSVTEVDPPPPPLLVASMRAAAYKTQSRTGCVTMRHLTVHSAPDQLHNYYQNHHFPTSSPCGRRLSAGGGRRMPSTPHAPSFLLCFLCRFSSRTFPQRRRG